ncbi:TrkH family potassium uptake protein [Stappia taiwanensis]|uniref:Trk system potassium uptake protein n=1 Tax=Stappia taiwanensis TaxID=992267 RepID=A0A838XJQ7_9HYPH|nr:TrkH family potassium uptake protein [Stappia taiwanensis]MBA4611569.1 TrkH family potassium uptake protein [Stappia taiwanensis]GGE99241.1 Trk system potassium uptake protein [Stappia taiwanensis]
MDYRAVALPIGRLMILIAAFMLIPAGADLMVGNPDWVVFTVSALVVGCTGGVATAAFLRRGGGFNIRETLIFVNAAWLTFSLAGAMPLYLSGLDISATDALFEAASGLTTTGATVLTGLDHLPPGILLWRSLMQWIGGIGIVVLGIWLLPGLRVGGSQLFAIESSEMSAKPYGRFEPFMVRLLLLYFGLTLSCLLLYHFAGMTWFQAVNHALTTVSSGGFSTSDQSMGQFDSVAIQWIAIVFMVFSGLPFLFVIRAVEHRDFRENQQVLFFLGLAAVASVAAFTVLHLGATATPFRELTLSVFHVVSVMTTTGYAAADYLQWGSFATALFFLLTFVGGCSGSTSGGFKSFRILVLIHLIRAMVKGMLRPHRIAEPQFAGKPLSVGVREGVLIFGLLYAGTFAIFALIYAGFGLDLETALSASITALANVGPGVGAIIGPSGTFQSLPDPVKWMLTLQMILGRLEIISGIVILTPDFWTER